MATTERLYTLDAMRGVAAILVVLFHLGDLGFRVAPGGYLAVDFFFVLSGLVVASAYEKRLRKGLLDARRFMIARFIRFWPMFAIGLGLAVIKAVGQIAADDPQALPPITLAGSIGIELLLLPSPLTGVDLFPLNGPAWSLFLELAINLLFALFLFRTRRKWLAALAIMGGVIVVASALNAGHLNVGWGWPTVFGGIGRVTFAFCAGVVIWRLRIARPSNAGALMLLPIMALVGILLVDVPASIRPLFDCAIALVAAPLLVVLGGRWQSPPRLRGACEVLGDLSYPLYAIHFPLVFMAGFAARRLELEPLYWMPPFVIVLLGCAWLLGRYVDPAARAGMTRLLTGRRPVVAAPS